MSYHGAKDTDISQSSTPTGSSNFSEQLSASSSELNSKPPMLNVKQMADPQGRTHTAIKTFSGRNKQIQQTASKQGMTRILNWPQKEVVIYSNVYNAYKITQFPNQINNTSALTDNSNMSLNNFKSLPTLANAPATFSGMKSNRRFKKFYNPHEGSWAQTAQAVDEEEKNEKRRRRAGAFIWDCCCCCCLWTTVIGAIIIAALIATAVILVFIQDTSTSTTTVQTTTSTSVTSTTVTTATTTTSTSATSTTATTSTSTTSTSATTTTASTSTSTTATTESSTTSTSATSTTMTTSTTTTTAYDSCQHLQWNQTGIMVAGTGSLGSAANQFTDPGCIEIGANDTMYICDHHNYRLQKWPQGATTGITVANFTIEHPMGMTFDSSGYAYITGHQGCRVVRFSPDFTNSSTVAGVPNSCTSAANNLANPWGMDVDANLNLYVAEIDNQRVTQWAPGATSGVTVINPAANIGLSGILLSLYSSTQAYVSSESTNAVYLWNFGSSTPLVTLTQVNDTTSTLKKPKGLAYDTYGNLYVADQDNKRIVMYCANKTIGRVVADSIGYTTLSSADDVALDSNLNLYVCDRNGEKIVRFNRI